MSQKPVYTPLKARAHSLKSIVLEQQVHAINSRRRKYPPIMSGASLLLSKIATPRRWAVSRRDPVAILSSSN